MATVLRSFDGRMDQVKAASRHLSRMQSDGMGDNR